MRLALFWSEILHYHAARIRALCIQAEALGHSVYPFALRSASPDLPIQGYHDLLAGKITILSPDDARAGEYSKISQSQVIEFLNRHQPNAVGIVGYSSPAALAALGWCRQYRRGAILMSESKATDYQRSGDKERLKRQIVRCFDAALVGGSPQVAYALDLGLPADRVFVGYDAVDNEFWSTRSDRVRSESEIWRMQLGLPQHFFLTACRLVPKKNVAGLLRAYALYARQSSSAWPLVIAGDGRLRHELQEMASQLGVTEQVQFVGYLTADAMAPYYALASVFILASKTAEQWGLVVNEAMAAGTPVLVSKACGSAADLVVAGRTGFPFDPQDENALANLLASYSQVPADLSQMGIAARAHVDRFSPKVFAENFIAAAEAAVAQADARGTNYRCRLLLGAVRPLLREPVTGLE